MKGKTKTPKSTPQPAQSAEPQSSQPVASPAEQDKAHQELARELLKDHPKNDGLAEYLGQIEVEIDNSSDGPELIRLKTLHRFLMELAGWRRQATTQEVISVDELARREAFAKQGILLSIAEAARARHILDEGNQPRVRIKWWDGKLDGLCESMRSIDPDWMPPEIEDEE